LSKEKPLAISQLLLVHLGYKRVKLN